MVFDFIISPRPTEDDNFGAPVDSLFSETISKNSSISVYLSLKNEGEESVQTQRPKVVSWTASDEVQVPLPPRRTATRPDQSDAGRVRRASSEIQSVP